VNIHDPLSLFCALVVVHVLADFPLQGDYLARQKVRRTASGRAEWAVALSAHSILHAGGVWVVSDSLALGFVELVLHALIDWVKGEEKIGLLADQSLHLLCKIGYVTAWSLLASA
jgi:hypothetical protein